MEKELSNLKDLFNQSEKEIDIKGYLYSILKPFKEKFEYFLKNIEKKMTQLNQMN